MDIDLFIIGKEVKLMDGEDSQSQIGFCDDSLLRRLSLLFYKLRRKVGQEVYIVPLETIGLTPLLRAFFS